MRIKKWSLFELSGSFHSRTEIIDLIFLKKFQCYTILLFGLFSHFVLHLIDVSNLMKVWSFVKWLWSVFSFSIPLDRCVEMGFSLCGLAMKRQFFNFSIAIQSNRANRFHFQTKRGDWIKSSFQRISYLTIFSIHWPASQYCCFFVCLIWKFLNVSLTEKTFDVNQLCIVCRFAWCEKLCLEFGFICLLICDMQNTITVTVGAMHL